MTGIINTIHAKIEGTISRGIKAAEVDESGHLIFTLTDNSIVDIGNVVGPEGDPGVSPAVTITDIEGGHRVTITDAEHPQGQSFDVLDGQGGGTGDHRQLTNRDAADQHPMSAITGLVSALAEKQATISDLAAIRTGAGKGATAVQPSAIADMATQTWVEGKSYITAEDIPVLSVNGKTGPVTLTAADLGLSTVFNLKGSKPTYTALPATGNVTGDVWYVVDESVGYIWLNDGTTNRWEQLGLSVDLSNYVTTEALATALTGYVTKVSGKGLSTNDFTDAYKTKLDSAITSLTGYATEAWVEAKGYLTQHQSLAAYRTATAQDVIDGGKLDKSQGVAHAGEFLVVGSDGNVTTRTLSAWQGGSY